MFYFSLFVCSASDGYVKPGQAYVFWNLCKTYRAVAVVGIGEPDLGYSDLEEIDEKREGIRTAAHGGYRRK